MDPISWLLISVAFLASGAAALIFEIVWLQLAGLVFGSSVWATSVVLAAFMAGLGLGNWLAPRVWKRFHRPLRTYAVLEIVAGVLGVLLSVVLLGLPEALAPILRLANSAGPAVANGVRFLVAGALLLVPTIAMGMTLPVLTATLSARGVRFGRALGWLYGLNTMGAVAGVLLAELFLVRALGMRGVSLIAGLLNLSAAACAFVAAHRAHNFNSSAPVCEHGGGGSGVRVLVAAFGTGFALLSLEVLWFRFLSLFVTNSSLSVALMLAAVLAGISLGGLLGGWFASNAGRAARCMPYVAAASGLVVSLLYRFFGHFLVESRAFEWQTVVRYTSVLVLPSSILSGILFPLQGAVLRGVSASSETAAARLTLSNTCGAAIGALLTGLGLLPMLGLERSFFAVSIVYFAVAMLTTSKVRRAQVTTIAVLAVAIVTFPSGAMREFYVPFSAKRVDADAEVVATRDTPTETIYYMKKSWAGQPVYWRLATNGFSMSGTGEPALRYMRLFAFFPAIVSEVPIRNALLISYGVGVTARALCDLQSPQRIDVVDISPDILEMSDFVHAPPRHPLHDPRVRVHIEDGRQFLLTSDQRYDLITGEPPPPRLPGTVNLYTEEYFRLLRDRLADGGVVTYWLPISDLLEADTKAIVQAFADVFPDCSLWAGTPSDWMLVGFRSPPGRCNAARFESFWSDAVIGPQLRDMGLETPAQLGAMFLGDGPQWVRLCAGTKPLADNWPKRLQPLYSEPTPERMHFYGGAVSPIQNRQKFATSTATQALWPRDLVAPTLEAFEWQPVVNATLTAEPQPIVQIRTLDRLLRDTRLETLPLWLLGSNAAVSRIASAAGGAAVDGSVEYARALDALATRRYNVAANGLAAARAKGFSTATGAYLEVYARCMAGDSSRAREVATILRRSPAVAAHEDFWNFARERFGL